MEFLVKIVWMVLIVEMVGWVYCIARVCWFHMPLSLIPTIPSLHYSKVPVLIPILPVFQYSNTPDETILDSNSPKDYAHGQPCSLKTPETPLIVPLFCLAEYGMVFALKKSLVH